MSPPGERTPSDPESASRQRGLHGRSALLHRDVAAVRSAEQLVSSNSTRSARGSKDYSDALEGVAAGLKQDLRNVRYHREQFESIAFAAELAEHIGLRRTVASGVARRIAKAEADLAAGKRADAGSALARAAQDIRAMEAVSAGLRPYLDTIWNRDRYPLVEDHWITSNYYWWFTRPEVR